MADLSTAIAVREREDGLYEKDTFDLATAVPIDTIPERFKNQEISATKDPRYSPPLTDVDRARATIQQVYKDAGEEVPLETKFDWVLTSPTAKMVTSNILGGLLTGGIIPAYNALKGIANAESPNSDVGKMIFDSAYKGLAETSEVQNLGGAAQKAYPEAPWQITGTMGALAELAMFSGIVKNPLTKEYQYKTAIDNFKKSPKWSDYVTKVAEKSNTDVNVVAAELERGLYEAKGDISYFRVLNNNLKKLTGVDLRNEIGAVKIGDVKVGQTINFTDTKGLVKTGKIIELEGERAIIQMGISKVVANLNQLSIPEAPTPTGEGKVAIPTSKVKHQIRQSTGQIKVSDVIDESKALKRLFQREQELSAEFDKEKQTAIEEELANEDYIIKTYERDISKLEEKLKVSDWNIEGEKIKAEQKLVDLKQKYKDMQENRKQKQAMRNEVADLVSGIKNTPKEEIAVEYQGMIDELKSKFDLKNRNEKTVAKRESMKSYVARMQQEDRAIDIPKEKLAMLDKVTLKDMTIDQLRGVKETIDKLKQLGKTKLKARKAIYEATKETTKKQLMDKATPINSKQLPKVPIGDTVNSWIERAIKLQNYRQKTAIGLTPIDGLADVTGMTPMKKVLDSDFSKYLTYNDKAIEDWYNLTKDLTDKNFERIGVIAASRQEGGIERLANSGITEEEIQAVQLTPEEEKVYKFVVDTFNKEYPMVKQYSKEVYNADVGQQENYVSFMSDYEMMSDLEIYERFGNTPEQIANRKTKTVEQGFTKERTNLSKIKLETNIDKIFRRHMDDVAYMINTGKNIKMYFEIINSPEMKEKLGDVGTLAWLQWLDLMARKGGAEGAKRIAALDILRRNIGAGVLGFRLSSALVQFSSFADTIATMGSEWSTKGAVSIATSSEWRKFIIDNFPEVKKAIGDDIAFREFGETWLAGLTRAGTLPLRVLDGVMRSVAASSAYQKLAFEKGIAVDFSNPDKDLTLEATKLLRNSQGSSFFKDQPLAITAGYGLSDNRSLNKTLLTFQSFMLNRWDNINRQIWRMGIKEKDYKKAASSFFWLIIFASALEEGLRRGGRKIINTVSGGDKKEEPFVKEQALNAVQSVPILGQIVSSLTYSSNPVPVLNAINDVVESAGYAVKSKKLKTKVRNSLAAILAAGSLAGVPGSSQASQIVKKRLSDKKKKDIFDTKDMFKTDDVFKTEDVLQ